MDFRQIEELQQLEDLHWLDLGLHNIPRQTHTSHRKGNLLRITCNFPQENYKHHLHSSEFPLLNSLSDLLINFGRTQQEQYQYFLGIIQNHSEKLQNIEKELKLIRINQDYLKSSTANISSPSSVYFDKFSSKQELEEVISAIQNQPKDIEVKTEKLLEDISSKTEIFEQKISEVKNLISELTRLYLS